MVDDSDKPTDEPTNSPTKPVPSASTSPPTADQWKDVGATTLKLTQETLAGLWAGLRPTMAIKASIDKPVSSETVSLGDESKKITKPTTQPFPTLDQWVETGKMIFGLTKRTADTFFNKPANNQNVTSDNLPQVIDSEKVKQSELEALPDVAFDASKTSSGGNPMKSQQTRHLMSFMNSKLKPDEQVLGVLTGWIGEMMRTGDKRQQNGQFILTNLRVCFCRKGLVGEVFETIPLEKVTSVETLSRIGYRVIRLHTSHDELAFKTFETKDLFEQVYKTLEAARDALSATSHKGFVAESIPDQIKKLAELRDAGILTESEFSTKKQQLLEKM
ncbi:MAG: SHOCT domain-containing protein [Planctomycetia bacterium]|nr:SHOCT domain-containing protein [Planctomycetia bacterium]